MDNQNPMPPKVVVAFHDGCYVGEMLHLSQGVHLEDANDSVLVRQEKVDGKLGAVVAVIPKKMLAFACLGSAFQDLLGKAASDPTPLAMESADAVV